MESNWRYNVLDYFYNELEMTKAARLLVQTRPPFFDFVVQFRSGFPRHAIAWPTVGGYANDLMPIFTPGPFPYGYGVFPDR